LGHKIKDERIGGSAPEDGKTIYLGSRRTSPVFLRAYEKGKEQYAKTGDPFWLDLFDLARLELVLRPQKGFKRTAATLTPFEAWGRTSWSAQVAHGVVGMRPEPIKIIAPRMSDHEGRMRHCLAQYGPTLRDHLELMGSMEAFAFDLARRLGVGADEESPQAA
jgi:hypothetical protein